MAVGTMAGAAIARIQCKIVSTPERHTACDSKLELRLLARAAIDSAVIILRLLKLEKCHLNYSSCILLAFNLKLNFEYAT